MLCLLLQRTTATVVRPRLKAISIASLLLSTYPTTKPSLFVTAGITKRQMSNAPPPSSSGIDLYSWPTPNGLKITVALEELKEAGVAVEYTYHPIDISKNESKSDWYIKTINPNGRIPALVDRDNNNLHSFETGSMLLYLANYRDKEFKLHFKEPQEELDMTNWIFFQHGGYGPMAGQAGFFLGHAVKQPIAAKRYIDETKRLLSVYEARLQEDGGRDFLVGAGKGKLSYADIASFTWVRAAPLVLGESISKAGFPAVDAWVQRLNNRPASKRAIPADGFVDKILNAPDAEQKLKDRVKWVYESDRKKDEL
ncbi:Glutathione S-transferase 2 [Microbotryomycetes sp. JL221]|nr:Glutathione S-transferase 2 [Microbotryomycetes sp. JL221]